VIDHGFVDQLPGAAGGHVEVRGDLSQ